MNIFERLESNVRGYCRTYPAIFDKASNARQWDEGGNDYIDLFAGAGVLNYGHNNPALRQAMIEYMQNDGVAHSLDMYSTSKRAFIERFEKTILKPRKLDYKLQFTGPTGTNVVEAALKLARMVTGRRTVACFTNGYHGMTLGALAVTGNSHFRKAGGVPLHDVVRLPFDGYLGDQDTLEAMRQMLADSSSGMEAPAAFLVETVQAEGGVNVARPEWLREVQALARETGALFIVDDIQLGNGRTGRFFSFEDMGLDPDLICMAKGIGGFGTPMGLLLIKPEHDKWQPGEHTGTFRGQNLSFVAGTEALAYYEDGGGFLASVAEKGQFMAERLQTIAAEHASRKFAVRGRGMMQGLDTGDPDLAKQVMAGAARQRVIVAPCGTGGRVIKVCPPLTIEQETLAEGLDRLAAAVQEGVTA